jgi:hypothetical protein
MPTGPAGPFRSLPVSLRRPAAASPVEFEGVDLG